MAKKKQKSLDIKVYDSFVYTDIYGNQKTIDSKESIRSLFNKRDSKKEITQLLQMWFLELSKLKQLSTHSERVEHYINHMFFLEKQIHNFGFVFDNIGVLKKSDVKDFKKYKPFLNSKEIEYVNKLYLKHYDEIGFENFCVLRDKFVEQAIILSLNFDDYQKAHSEYKFSQSDVSQMLDELAHNRQSELPKPLKEMVKDRGIYKNRFNRWLEKRYQAFGIKDYQTAIEEHWNKIEYDLTWKKGLTPITELADSKIFIKDKVHIQILQDLWATFHEYFSNKNDSDFKISLTPVGTADTKVPHMVIIDKDYAIRIAKENKQFEDYQKRFVKKETEAIKDNDYYATKDLYNEPITRD